MTRSPAKQETQTETRKRKRAESRIALYGSYPGVGETNQKSFLEQKSVSTARQQSYAKSWEGFTQWAKMNRLKVETSLDIDKAAAERMNFLFFDGHDLADVHTLMAAIKFFRQDIPRLGGLLRATAALKGFTKLEPPQGRVPIPFPVFAMILRQIWNSHKLIALWLMMTWATCARPGEAHRLTCQDVVPPSRMTPFYVVILNSGSGPVSQSKASQKLEELEVKRPRPTSKVGELDEAVLLDQPYLLGAGALLHSLAKKGKAKDPLFNFSLKDGTEVFNQTLQDLDLVRHGINCVYQVRHRSASTDALIRFRSLVDIQKRGRWRSQRSVTRYSNGGRISQVFNNLDKHQKMAALSAEQWISKTLGAGEVCKTVEIDL